jgi:hypothetical protein
MMATWGSDTAYAMLSKLSPRRADPVGCAIARRWEELKPWVLMEARKALDPADAFSYYREQHSRYLRRLLVAGITMKAVRNSKLDDPTETPSRFDLVLAEAMERRRARMGRVKGRVKPPPRLGKRKKETKR